jgi:hypothetical protein
MKPASPLLMENANIYSRETAFDPLNYAFDAETMIEPFTYFQYEKKTEEFSKIFFSYFHLSNGPAESRRKPIIFSSIPSPSSLSNFSWSPASSISSSDEHPQSSYHQFNNMLHVKHQPQQQYQYPKTICRHCKSHNMPECLYTCMLNSFLVILIL